MLSRYAMRTSDAGGDTYVLTIPDGTEEELADTIHNDILRKADLRADDRHCFIEADVRALDGSERGW